MASSGENPQFTQDELETLIDIANDYNFHAAAHAHGAMNAAGGKSRGQNGRAWHLHG